MMSKAVMLSIRPKWCELIANGTKTVEVRKSRPKLHTPFKCYIYCTKDARDSDRLFVLNEQRRQEYGGLVAVCANLEERPEYHCVGNGKVIGEFMCYATIPISVEYSDPSHRMAQRDFPFTGMTDKQIIDYLGNGKMGYGWHISDLKIYDKPRELREFKKSNRDCFYADLGLAKRDCPDCKNSGCFLERPPQSWCYVEEG